MLRCTDCSADLPGDANYCLHCGAQVVRAATGPTERLSRSDVYTCPKCSGIMEIGFIPDYYRRSDTLTIWVQGQATRDWLGNIDYKNQRQWLVTTFCCSQCGFLESFATEEIKPAP